MRLGRTFYFDSSHYLPDYDGKCEKHHGHTYRLDIIIEGPIADDGMVLDFGKLKEKVDRLVLTDLDHACLNDIVGNPTAENIAEWIWERLSAELPMQSVRLWEGKGKWVEKRCAL